MLESGTAKFQGFHLAFPVVYNQLIFAEQSTIFSPHNPCGMRQYSYYGSLPTTGLMSSSSVSCCNCDTQPPHKPNSYLRTISCPWHVKTTQKTSVQSGLWHHPRADFYQTLAKRARTHFGSI